MTIARPPVVVLGIDVGSTNTKVAVLEISSGRRVDEIAVRSVPTATDVDALLEDVADAIRSAVGGGAARPAAVGVASMAETGAPLDEAGAPLAELLGWRGAQEEPGLVEPLRVVDRFAATGVPATPKPAVVALARLRRDAPRLAARLRGWAGVADLVARGLTGALATDHTLALRTAALPLPAPGAPVGTAYDPGLLAPFGLDPALLPPIVAPGAAAGRVTAAAAERMGLGAGVPVFVAGHDHLVGAWAAGVRGPGRVADSLGTAEALIRFPGTVIDRSALAGSGSGVVRSVDGRTEGVLTASTGAGAAVAAWYGTDLPSPALWRDALRMLPDAGGLLVLPYPTGRQAPAPDPTASMRLVDLDGRPVDRSLVTAVDAARALLLGLALQARWMDDAQRAAVHAPIEPTTVIGGAGTENPAWLAWRAALATGPVERVAVAEPVAAGAALLAGVRAGLVDAATRLSADPVAAPAVPAASLDAAFRAAALAPVPGGAR